MGDIASGNALKAGSGETASGIPYVDVPVNVTAAAKQAASGLMVYIREVNKGGRRGGQSSCAGSRYGRGPGRHRPDVFLGHLL